MLSDANGLPLVAGISAANTHDSQALMPLVRGIPAIRSPRGPRRRRPDKLHADKAYDIPALHVQLRDRGITPRIARIGIDRNDRLGTRRWVIERTLSWTTRYRRLTRRYDRNPHSYAGFLGLARALITYHRLTN